ncbi:hypothetical protein ACEWY4_002313 [Coilia grayii]|uniref:Uncharacterized protein n=1 Tax=Coilia grayii TaxID=363190 RepID=A0ABD1KMY2_9TELE
MEDKPHRLGVYNHLCNHLSTTTTTNSGILFALTITIFAWHVDAVPVTCGLQRRLLDESHRLLEGMSGLFPLECLDLNLAIAFPFSALETSEAAENSASAERAAYEALMLIDTVFAMGSMPASWKYQEDFQQVINRQIEESKCRYSVCAWEVARKEILRTLKLILHNSNYLI